MPALGTIDTRATDGILSGLNALMHWGYYYGALSDALAVNPGTLYFFRAD